MARTAPSTTQAGVHTASPPLTRILGLIVLAVMAIATVYTAWIALANFTRIGV